ncbi:GntR family transcriptional regulator [Homoserinibacter sp. GY 40078]|uniref:GntR family transcriptional regulator n=1 Tax=Homoserinibacter sp. GY 40078 TaxID=2603275 RepID=UPI00164FA4ED|nr:GntR family transcriptional regulator [Homoserinibacter sp. GY 40078]
MHERITESLRSEIISGQYPPGSALPSEAQLCGIWGVSRGPVRHAIQTLSNEGYLKLSRGKAATVRARPVLQNADSYTPFSQWARATGHTFGQQTESFSMHASDDATAALLDVTPGDRIFEMTRLRLLDGRPCMLERSIFTEPVGRLLMQFDLDSGGISDYLAERGVHYSVIEQQIDAVPADSIDATQLQVPVGSPLLRVRRRAADDAGVVWEFSDDRYLPDVVSFHTSFRRELQAN